MLHEGQGDLAQIDAVFDEIAQFEQTNAELVAACIRALHEVLAGERGEDAVRRGRVQAGAFADFLERDGLLPGRQHIDQLEHALQHLHAGFGLDIRRGFLHGNENGW